MTFQIYSNQNFKNRNALAIVKFLKAYYNGQKYLCIRDATRNCTKEWLKKLRKFFDVNLALKYIIKLLLKYPVK